MKNSSYSENPEPYVNVYDAERVVLRALRARHGETAQVCRPIRSVVTGLPLGVGSECVPADPVAGMVAAQQLFGAARHTMRRYGAAARAAGHSWSALAAALHLDGDDAAAAAFDYLTPEVRSWCEDRYLRWRCESCGRPVTDRGPYSGNPADNEDGHAPDCARHAADINAHHTEAWADTDDPDDGCGDDYR